MKVHSNYKIDLSKEEKISLRKHKVRISQLTKYDVLELEELLAISYERAREIRALIQFQSIPSIGIKFAEDLVSMSFFSIEELKGKDGARLVEQFEKQQGYWIDSCVEDQFRLVVHFAETGDTSKNWWHFTNERKEYRQKFGYSKGRPTKAWHDHS